MLTKTVHLPLHVTQALERVLHVPGMERTIERFLFGIATLRTETPNLIMTAADVNFSTASRYATLSVQLRLRPLTCPRRHPRCSRAGILLYTATRPKPNEEQTMAPRLSHASAGVGQMRHAITSLAPRAHKHHSQQQLLHTHVPRSMIGMGWSAAWPWSGLHLSTSRHIDVPLEDEFNREPNPWNHISMTVSDIVFFCLCLVYS